jgi:hypothetical protein
MNSTTERDHESDHEDGHHHHASRPERVAEEGN